MAASRGKSGRQRVLLELVESHELGSQRALAEALAARGHPVSQSTLSRDLAELGIARVPGPEGSRYALAIRALGEGEIAASRRMLRVAAAEVRAVGSNESLVVVRTLTGRAQGVAVWIDGQGFEAVLGTVAGDDTILVVPRTAGSVPELRRALAAQFGVD